MESSERSKWQRLTATAFLIGGSFLALWLLYTDVFTTSKRLNEAATSITANARIAGFEFPNVSINGSRAIIEGIAPSVEARDRALDFVRQRLEPYAGIPGGLNGLEDRQQIARVPATKPTVYPARVFQIGPSLFLFEQMWGALAVMALAGVAGGWLIGVARGKRLAETYRDKLWELAPSIAMPLEPPRTPANDQLKTLEWRVRYLEARGRFLSERLQSSE